MDDNCPYWLGCFLKSALLVGCTFLCDRYRHKAFEVLLCVHNKHLIYIFTALQIALSLKACESIR